MKPKSQSAVLRPPSHITGTARKEWKRILAALERQGALNPADLALIASYATAYGRWLDAEKEVAEQGVIVKTKSGNFIQNPYLGVANTAMKLTNRYGRELGFSPLARQEVKWKGGQDGRSILDGLDDDDDEDAPGPFKFGA